MGINKLYLIGMLILFVGFLALMQTQHFIGAFFIGIGFILILKSYVK